MIVTPVTEDQLQAAFWKECWNNYPHARRCMWAVPNTSVGRIITLKDQIQVNLLKSTGLLEGVWDLHLLWYNTFHIFETKVGNNQLTVDRIDSKGKKHYGQKEWGELMAAHGAVRHIYRSLEDGVVMFEAIVGKVPVG